jgi:uncharacterized membrane protein (UPF0127 family)
VKNANPVSSGLRAAAALFLASLGAGCGAGKPPEAASAPMTVLDHFTVGVGGRTLSLQFAVTQGEQERGLMQRMDLGKDEGMIFVAEAPQRERFWMKNTPEPLDIAFAGRDGVIAEIYPLYPFNLQTLESRGDRMVFAVETRQGWFSENGVRAGAAIDLKAVAAALKARGFDPAKYGLGVLAP